MHRRVETPRGPKYQGVKTPWCPRYRRVMTPQCPKYQGVKILQYFVSQNSPVSYVLGSRDSSVLCESKLLVSYVPGSQDSSVLCESKLPDVLCTGESFFVSLNLQAHAAALKATLIQKTFLILAFTIQIQFKVQTYLKVFPN